MDAVDRLADRVAQWLALVGSLGVLAMLVHVGLDVATRNLSGQPIPATNEIVSRYYMVLIAFLPLGFVERRGAMISVELSDWLLTPALRRVSDAAVALLAAAVYAVLAWVTWDTALTNWRSGSFVDALGHRIPVWPTYFLPPLGFALAAAITLLRALHRPRTRDEGER